MPVPFVKFSFLAIALLTAAGCSTLGGGEDKFNDAYVRSHVIPHKTTLNEIQAMYGSPDTRNSRSDGSLSLTYHKRSAGDQLNSLYNLAGSIPGGDKVSSALADAKGKGYNSNNLDRASNSLGELTGNQQGSISNSLSIDFDKDSVVTNWSF
ncbi:hypothetical protein HNP46_004608 [Pseudomonas nitritireducens]|uniref:Lipoprotein n=1 Tax=Pseudomonas nitroreducens TaxID=46680 RepID=A0A7W7KMU7_PSENT|nr:hypothetical protein [Pseudomonas nitritireducens]MBB4865707.1 hypothetical protein [Pseudomonas nitritireducens]